MKVSADRLDFRQLVTQLRAESKSLYRVSKILRRARAAQSELEHVTSQLERFVHRNGTSRLGRRPRRHMSAAARRRISQAMKQRWAARKVTSAAKPKSGPKPKPNAHSLAMSRRWAAYHAGKGPRPGGKKGGKKLAAA